MSVALGSAGCAMTLGSGDVTTFAPLFPVMLAVHAVACWFAADALRQIPERYRFREPKVVWLLLIPLFRQYWNFKIYPEIAESFQVFFYSRGIADVDDCGESLARVYCWLSLCSLIPCAGLLAVPPALVVLVLFLIQADKLKRRVALLERAG